MNIKKFVTATLVIGVVMNILDFVVQGNLLAGYYTSGAFRQDAPIAWFVFGDFIAAAVFVWFYARVAQSFAAMPGGGAVFGFYAGVFASFPAYIFLHLMLKDFPYALSWIWTIYGVVWCVIAGALAGWLYRK